VERADVPRTKQRILAMCIAIDLATLVHFKYTDFIIDNVNVALSWAAAGWAGLTLPHGKPILLPLGISFFTFHLLSYVIDIYRGSARAQRNPIDFALYICFFPQLIAGPIIRYHDVESQLTNRRMSFDRFASGLERFILGMGKKVLLANPFGEAADRVWALTGADLSPGTAWFGLLAYALQLYYDFSGYSDMAIGLGRMFGFDYLENFNYPFISKSISEFWRRWHISLSNWFRDYMYTPMVLAAARRAAGKTAAAGIRRRPKIDDRPYLALVFLVCGIWHGASWTFVIWGGIHGVFLALERGRFGKRIQALPAPLAHIYVLSVIMLAWVFFRAPTLGYAAAFLFAMAGHSGMDAQAWQVGSFVDRQILLLLPLALLALTPALSCMSRDWRGRALQSFGQLDAAALVQVGGAGALDQAMMLLRPPILLGILVLAACYIAGETYNPFIYFRF
jgi:alginate O-acetyltransferase complex protein AlgI